VLAAGWHDDRHTGVSTGIGRVSVTILAGV
jgi:hypothetical protein